MNKIGIIRHGSTSWNEEGRAQGNSTIALNKEGLSGANKVAERLRKENWDLVYASNLMRASRKGQKSVDCNTRGKFRLQYLLGG